MIKNLVLPIVATAVLAVSVRGAAALPCNLTQQDYQSLANTGNKYSRAEIDRLDTKVQDNLCKARKFYHEAAGQDPVVFGKTHTINDVPVALSRYLTASEYEEIRAAFAEVMSSAPFRR